MQQTSPASLETGQTLPSARLPVLPPWQAIAELCVLTSLIIGLDWVLTSVDLADMQPNPFWFPILLLSLQYGTVSGVLAAGVAIVATMLSGIPEQGVGENHFAYLVRVWAQPILWLAAAVFFGQFRMRQIAAKQELQRLVQELSSQRSALAEFSTNLRNRCDALERELVARPAAPAQAVLDALTDLGTAAAPDHAFSHVIESFLPRASATLFRLEGGRLVCHARAGWPAPTAYPAEVDPADPLHAAVVVSGETVSILDEAGDQKLGRKGLLAVPVRSSDGARVLGMIRIERAEPGAVDVALIDRLRTVAAALAPALEGRAAPLAIAGPRTASVVSGARPRAYVKWRPAGRAEASKSGQSRARS